MIPTEVAAIATLIFAEWSESDEVTFKEVLASAWRIYNAGYRERVQGGHDDWKPADDEIDRGGEALRARQMSGRITRAWSGVPNAENRKWRDHAEAVLRAALIFPALEDKK